MRWTPSIRETHKILLPYPFPSDGPRFGWVGEASLGRARWHAPPLVPDFRTCIPPLYSRGQVCLLREAVSTGRCTKLRRENAVGTGGQVQTELLMLDFRSRRRPGKHLFLCFQCWYCVCTSST